MGAKQCNHPHCTEAPCHHYYEPVGYLCVDHYENLINAALNRIERDETLMKHILEDTGLNQ